MTLPLKHIIAEMNKIAPLSADLQLRLHENTTRLEVPKDHILLKPDEVCNFLYYIEDGILCCTRVKDGKEYGAWLMQEGNIATSVDSFNFRLPSNEIIITITPCILHTLHWDLLEAYTEEEPAFRKVRQRLTDVYHSQAREMDIQRKAKPEEFYQYLQSVYGDNFNRIPDKVLYSFMAVSKNTFTKCKKIARANNKASKISRRK